VIHYNYINVAFLFCNFSTGNIQTNDSKLQKCCISLIRAFDRFSDDNAVERTSLTEVHIVNKNDKVCEILVSVFDAGSKHQGHNVTVNRGSPDGRGQSGCDRDGSSRHDRDSYSNEGGHSRGRGHGRGQGRGYSGTPDDGKRGNDNTPGKGNRGNDNSRGEGNRGRSRRQGEDMRRGGRGGSPPREGGGGGGEYPHSSYSSRGRGDGRYRGEQSGGRNQWSGDDRNPLGGNVSVHDDHYDTAGGRDSENQPLLGEGGARSTAASASDQKPQGNLAILDE